MATYIGLFNWTEQGIKGYRDSAERVDAFGQLLERAGGSLQGIWWCLGPYDVVAVMDAPDDEAITAAMLQLGALGNVRSTTLRAFGKEEFQGIATSIG
jgi:uncharacterized protein with GYD domain